MTVKDHDYPPLVYTIEGKTTSMKIEVRSILYGYLTFLMEEDDYIETFEDFLDMACSDLGDIVLETTDVSVEECVNHFRKVKRICLLLYKRYCGKHEIWE